MFPFQTNRPRVRSSITALPAGSIAAYALTSIVLIGLAGCRMSSDDSAGEQSPTVVTTIHPFGTLLRPIVGEAGTVSTLLPAGVSPHTYSPRPSDARRAAGSRVLVFGHRHLDGWAADISAPAHIELFALLPDSLRMPFPPGLLEHQARPTGDDPHFWTDPLAVKATIGPLIDALCNRIPDHCSTFQTNGSALADRLDSLHHELRQQMRSFRGRPVLLATPFFQYFLDRYGLSLAGVIEPVPGGEIPARTLQGIIQTARRQEIDVILATEQHSARMAQTVSHETGIPLLRLDLIADESRASTYEALILDNAHLLLNTLD